MAIDEPGCTVIVNSVNRSALLLMLQQGGSDSDEEASQWHWLQDGDSDDEVDEARTIAEVPMVQKVSLFTAAAYPGLGTPVYTCFTF